MTSNALRSTVRYDEEIARWSVRLLAHKAVAPFFKNAPECAKFSLFLPAHVLIMIVNLAVAGYIFKAAFFPKRFDLLIVLSLLAGAYLIEILYKDLLADLVTAFIKSEFSEDDLKKITILQMSVRLEKKFNIPGIVDTLCGWMLLFRFGLVFSYTVLLLIFIPFKQAAVILLGIAWASRALARSSLLANQIIK